MMETLSFENLPKKHGFTSVEEEVHTARECLEQLKDLIAREGKLKVPPNDVFLLKFIRARNYNLKKTYDNLLRYYEARLKYPESFQDFVPSRYHHVLESGAVALLRHRDEGQRMTFVLRVARWDPAFVSLDEVIMTSLLVAEHMSTCEVNQRVGAIILVDLGGLSLGHIKSLSLVSMYKLVYLFQDSFPGIYKGIHLINQPFVFDVFLNLVKRLLKQKLRNCLTTHRSVDTMGAVMSVGILPTSMGGSLPVDEAFDDALLPAMLRMEGYYEDLQNYGFLQTCQNQDQK
jgi:hypothetical protein